MAIQIHPTVGRDTSGRWVGVSLHAYGRPVLGNKQEIAFLFDVFDENMDPVVEMTELAQALLDAATRCADIAKRWADEPS